MKFSHRRRESIFSLPEVDDDLEVAVPKSVPRIRLHADNLEVEASRPVVGSRHLVEALQVELEGTVLGCGPVHDHGDGIASDRRPARAGELLRDAANFGVIGGVSGYLPPLLLSAVREG